MATINENAQDADKTVKKLQTVWDNFLQYVHDNSGTIEKEALEKLKSAQQSLEQDFKNLGQEIEKGTKKTDEKLRNNLPTDFQEGFDKFTKQFEQQTKDFRTQVKNAAEEAQKGFQKFQAKEAIQHPVANAKLMMANAQFKAAAHNLTDAFKLLSESVKERAEAAAKQPKG